MKKTTKSMLVSALILFLSGVILSLSAALFAKIRGVDAYGMEHPSKIIEDKELSLEQLLAASSNSNYVKKLTDKEFVRISFHTFSGNIVLQSGKKTSLKLSDADTSNLSYEIIGETLTVSEKNPVGFMGIFMDQDGYSFRGLRQVFGGGNSLNTKKTITLTLGEDVKLENVEIQNGIGSVTVDQIYSANFDIHSHSGDISVSNLKNANAKLNIVGNTSDISIADSVYLACSVTAKVGNITAKIPSELCKSTVISTWIGGIDVSSDVPTSAFKLTLETKVGSASKNGEKLGKSVKDSSQLANRITAETILGDIDLSFSGDDESSYVAIDAPVKDQTSENSTTDL